MRKEKNHHKTFEIVIRGEGGDEKKLVERISFPEAVRDAYMLVATSCHTKKIISVRVID